MTLSLSPHHQLKQIIHTPSISSKPLPYSSTPRQFTSVLHGGHANGHESLAKPLLLTPSRVKHATLDEAVDLNELTPPNRVVHDLPSWTPLKVTKDGGFGSPEPDDLLIGKRIVSASERDGGRSTGNAQATGESSQDAVTTGRTPKLPASPSKRTKARFDGILISTKPPTYTKHISPPKPASAAPSTKPRAVGGPLSLVDALARTFNANQHAEVPFLPAARPIHANARRRPREGASTETETPENEQLQLNTRLVRHVPSLSLSKKRHALTRTSRANSSSNSDVARSETTGRVGRLTHGIPRPSGFNVDNSLERPIKRLKVVQYETNTAWIDAALGTVEAPISWDAGLVSIPTQEVKDEDVSPEQTPQKVHARPSSMAVDESDPPPPVIRPTSEFRDSVSVSTPAPVVNVTPSPRSNATSHMEKFPTPKRVGVLSPYKSRGAKFRQRLADAFGTDVAVRTDRSARPRSMLVYQDEYYPMLDSDVVDDRARSPAPSESTASSSSAVSVPAATPEEGGEKSALPSTHITSLSLGDVPAQIQFNGAGSATTTITATAATTAEPTNDEQIDGWIVALQRLVKGKVRVKEEDLETLSIVLAEIESIKDNLDASFSKTSELRQSIQQLSQLYEIPFGDINKLRLRAKTIAAYWGA